MGMGWVWRRVLALFFGGCVTVTSLQSPAAGMPCVGRVSRGARELLVVGTVHTPSSQQRAEVASLIRSSKPDVVVVELDQERYDQLLSEVERLGKPPPYGAELAEAVHAAKSCGAAVMLGDAACSGAASFGPPPGFGARAS